MFFQDLDSDNPTAQQLGILLASAVSGLCWVALLVGGLWAGLPQKAWLLLLIPFILFPITYKLFVYMVNSFIYRRIKAIYRVMQNTDDAPANTKTKRIEQVNEEVEEWVTSQRKEVESLRELEQYRREFIGNVSHELKTPIFNIQGYLETLLDGGIDDPHIAEKYLQRAADNTDRLSTIVDDLNTIAQLESDSIALKIERFDLRALLEEIFSDLAAMAFAKNIKLRCKQSVVLPVWVMGDRERIRQVFINLITNAIKYGFENGFVQISFFDADDRKLIEVSDNGIGIEAQYLPRLFERFYRIDTARSREAGGSGLGLAIVKHIIEAHHQIIRVRSKIDEGTTFSFSLPKGA